MSKASRSAGECVFLDFGECCVRGWFAGASFDVQVERGADLKMAPASTAAVKAELDRLLRRRPAGGRRAYCALPARGVSLRRLRLPAGSAEETRRLVSLQLESVLPLSPDQLVWGYAGGGAGKGAARGQTGDAGAETAVVALRRELFDDYGDLIAAYGLRGLFLLRTLAVSLLAPSREGLLAVVHAEPGSVELALLADGQPLALRRVPCSSGAESEPLLESTVEAVVESLRGVPALNGLASTAPALLVAGAEPWMAELARQIGAHMEARLGRPPRVTALNGARVEGGAAVRQALELFAGSARREALLSFAPAAVAAGSAAASKRRGVRFWLGVAAVLALLSLSLRYAVPLGRSAQLAERLAEGRAELAAHPSLDAELEFLREVERTRAELDGLEILESIATSAPEGTRLSSVSLERGGDVFLVGSVTDQASANAFRSRLLATGRCETAVLEVSAAEGEVQFRMVVRMRSAPQPDTRE